MNHAILQKCIAELSKATPDLSYLRGMLETLLELQSTPVLSSNPISAVNMPYIPPSGFPPLAKTVTVDSPEGMAVEAALASLTGMPAPKPGIIEKNTVLN